MFDPTLHIGDIITLAGFGVAAWVRVSAVLARIEQFMRESSQDRRTLHHRLDLLEHRMSALRKAKTDGTL